MLTAIRNWVIRTMMKAKGETGIVKTLPKKEIVDINTRLSSAEATWQMAENLYRQLADEVREHAYDIKDLSR